MRIREYDEDRYDRMKRIEWLDLERMHVSKCLIVGAGALGNEVAKSMALAGFHDITILDMDRIVASNLSRSIFFKDEDVGRMKAEVVASKISDSFPFVSIKPIVSRIQELEDWDFDIVLGCLDNVQARLHTNSHARYHRIPYIDGATDGFRGKVQVVLPEGPCLECIMNKSHMAIMDQRFSCTGNGTIFSPKFASEITTTSIVAAVQVREAMKILSCRSDMCINNVMYYNGEMGTMDEFQISVDPRCPNHETEGPV